MKILIYVPTIVIDRSGGDSVHVRELAENLSKLGNEVVVICRLGSDVYHGRATIRRVASPNIKVIGWFWANIYGLFLGLVTVRGGKYALGYTRAGFSASAWFISRLAKVPCVTEVNGLIWDEAKISWVGWWRKAFGYFLNWIEGKAYKRGEHVIAVTLGIKKALIADFDLKPEKITVIQNGANTDLFKPMDTVEARRELNLNQNGNYICFVGSLWQVQGVEYLIKAAPLAVGSYPNARFLIVGDGEMKQELVELAERIGVSDKVIFTGMVPYDKVPLYINASDICVAPFIRQLNKKGGLCSLKMHEYLACGKPLLISRLNELDSLEQNGAALLVEPENPQELGNAIIKLLKDESLRKQMGENGRKYVVENHSWESVAKRVAEVCEQTLQEYRKKRNKRKL